MSDIDLEGAVLAASKYGKDSQKVKIAIDGILSVHEWLDNLGTFKTMPRLAAIIGQCAHESMGFKVTEEGLFYTTPERLMKIWPGRFPTLDFAGDYVRSSRKLANYVYGTRNGNHRSNDGWKYRGRGYLQLTGRANYKHFGKLVDLELEKWPELAKPAPGAWKIAAAYCANRSRGGKTVFEWADEGNVEMVTKIINGGHHGLEDRRERTALALAVLEG